MRWEAKAECRNTEINLWFSTDAKTIAEAKAICAVCPVKTECLRKALRLKVVGGIWAGTTPDERKGIRRKWLQTGRIPAL